MKIAIDFDGTIVKHMFPEIGDPVPGAIEWMKQWQSAGARLILWTMRSDEQLTSDTPVALRDYLTEAVQYCATNGVAFDAINKGLGDRSWTSSPKAHAHVYVDDAAFGVPLIYEEGSRPYVDWSIVGPAIMKLVAGG